MILIDIDSKEEKKLAREYVAMLVESKASYSAYIEPSKARSIGSEEATLELNTITINTFSYSAHITAKPNRNTQKRFTAEGKGKSQALNQPESVTLPRIIQHQGGMSAVKPKPMTDSTNKTNCPVD